MALSHRAQKLVHAAAAGGLVAVTMFLLGVQLSAAAAPVGNGIALWLDANDLDGNGVASGGGEGGVSASAVVTWTNKAATMHASPVGNATGGVNPAFSPTGSANGLGQVTFNGSTTHKIINHHANLNGVSGLTVFAVATQTDGAGGGFRLLQKGEGFGTSTSPSVYWFNPAANAFGIAGSFGQNFPVTYSSAANGDAIFTSVFDETGGTGPSNPGKVFNYLNGGNRGQPTAGTSGGVSGTPPPWNVDGFLTAASYTGNTSNLYLGQRNNPSGTTGNFGGGLNELLIYNTNLNNAERIIVENYLQAKWNNSALVTPNLAIADDYYSGDTTAKGNYDFNVFGIGRINAGNQLNSNNSQLGLALSASLGDGEWALAGMNTFDSTPFSAAVPIESSTLNYGARWDRVWYVDLTTPDSLDVTMTFDFSDASTLAPNPGDEYSLLYSATNVFDWQLIDTATLGGVGGDQLLFNLSGLDASQSGYFTIGLNAEVPEPHSIALWILASISILGYAYFRGQRRR